VLRRDARISIHPWGDAHAAAVDDDGHVASELLAVSHLTKTYKSRTRGPVHALTDVSFSVDPGEIVGKQLAHGRQPLAQPGVGALGVGGAAQRGDGFGDRKHRSGPFESFKLL